MVEVGEVLTLSNNKDYVVSYTTKLDSKDYAFLIEKEGLKETMFVEYVDGHLEEVVEEDIIEKLLLQFKENKKD